MGRREKKAIRRKCFNFFSFFSLFNREKRKQMVDGETRDERYIFKQSESEEDRNHTNSNRIYYIALISLFDLVMAMPIPMPMKCHGAMHRYVILNEVDNVNEKRWRIFTGKKGYTHKHTPAINADGRRCCEKKRKIFSFFVVVPVRMRCGPKMVEISRQNEISMRSKMIWRCEVSQPLTHKFNLQHPSPIACVCVCGGSKLTFQFGPKMARTLSQSIDEHRSTLTHMDSIHSRLTEAIIFFFVVWLGVCVCGSGPNTNKCSGYSRPCPCGQQQSLHMQLSSAVQVVYDLLMRINSMCGLTHFLCVQSRTVYDK